MFNALDMDRKGNINAYDIERLLAEFKQVCSRSTFDEIELLINIYDRTDSRKICFVDF